MKTISRKRKNLEYIRTKNKIRTSFKPNLKSWFKFPTDLDSVIIQSLIQDNSAIVKKQILKKYKIPVEIKEVVLGQEGSDFIRNETTCLLEFVSANLIGKN